MNGTSPNDDHSDCVTNCVFDVSNGQVVVGKTINNDISLEERPNIVRYDLSPLNLGTQYLVDPFREGSHVLVSLCRRMSESECRHSPFVCQSYINKGGVQTDVNFGHFLSMEPKANLEEGFYLNYIGGDSTNCDSIRKSVVDVICDMKGDNVLRLGESSSACGYTFELRTKYGCRQCTKDDYTVEETTCDDGKRSVTYQKSTELCLGDEQQIVEEECDGGGVPIGLIVVICIIALVIIVLLVSALVIVYKKKQDLEVRYSKLRADGTEMENVPDTSVHSDDEDGTV